MGVSIARNQSTVGSGTVTAFSLVAQSAGNTVGDTVDFGSARQDITAQCFANGGTLTGGGVHVQVSQDGVHWVRLVESGKELNCNGMTVSTLGATETNFIAAHTMTAPTGAYRYARAVITTAITGGTVSVMISGSSA